MTSKKIIEYGIRTKDGHIIFSRDKKARDRGYVEVGLIKAFGEVLVSREVTEWEEVK